jgi:DNA repair photolyase
LTPAPRGRGATGNPPGRFESRRVDPPEDRWWQEDEGPPAAAPTTVTPEITRTILARNDSPDIGFDRSINPYKGCEHGCVYCFARPSHSYLGLSPGLDFETKIVSKPEAAALLRRELSRPGYRCQVIALGANTDPYQPAEKHLRITRAVLEVLAEFRHPVCIVTKSSLVLRDRDLLAPMARDRLASVLVSVTTLDRDLARRMEPRAASPDNRLRAIRALADAGIPVGVLASPMIPGLNDSELERILEACAAAGARSAGTILLRLPHELKDLFGDWLKTHYPLQEARVLGLLRAMRGGALYDAEFGTRMTGTGPHAELLARRFRTACGRLELATRDTALDTTRFRVPPRSGDQMGLFKEE